MKPELIIRAPYPISANRYWRIARNRIYKSPESMTYRNLIVAAYTDQSRNGFTRIDTGPVSFELVLHPKTTKRGTASKTRIDLDNALKVVIDAFNGLAYLDDKQITLINARIGDPVGGGGVTVIIRESVE